MFSHSFHILDLSSSNCIPPTMSYQAADDSGGFPNALRDRYLPFRGHGGDHGRLGITFIANVIPRSGSVNEFSGNGNCCSRHIYRTVIARAFPAQLGESIVDARE